MCAILPDQKRVFRCSLWLRRVQRCRSYKKGQERSSPQRGRGLPLDIQRSAFSLQLTSTPNAPVVHLTRHPIRTPHLSCRQKTRYSAIVGYRCSGRPCTLSKERTIATTIRAVDIWAPYHAAMRHARLRLVLWVYGPYDALLRLVHVYDYTFSTTCRLLNLPGFCRPKNLA